MIEIGSDGTAESSTAEGGGLSVPRWRVLNSWVSGFTLQSLTLTIQDCVFRGDKVVIANHNVNSLSLLQRDGQFREFFDLAQYVFIDGAPIVWLARFCGSPAANRNRVAVLDWIWPLFQIAEREQWRIVHVGGDRDLISAATRRIMAAHPNLRLTTLSGFFDVDDPLGDDLVLRQLAAARPAVLLIGMGMPRQEHWILRRIEVLPDCVIMNVGGIFGYLGGDRPTPPRWLGRTGMEWLFRLLTEPRRLWRRYLLEPVAILPVLLREVGSRIAAAWFGR